jgi:hypothetical protein
MIEPGVCTTEFESHTHSYPRMCYRGRRHAWAGPGHFEGPCQCGAQELGPVDALSTLFHKIEIIELLEN